MNLIERGGEFLQSLPELASRRAWDWRGGRRWGDTLTSKNGSDLRRPGFFDGRREVQVQRHWCSRGKATSSARSALLGWGSRNAREGPRLAIDHWHHGGSSVRRTAEFLRRRIGRQERWLLGHPLDPESPEEKCHLAARTVHRWRDRAGQQAQRSVRGQWSGGPVAGQMGTEGLWAQRRGGAKRVVLLLGDSAPGLLFPPGVGEGRGGAGAMGETVLSGQGGGTGSRPGARSGQQGGLWDT